MSNMYSLLNYIAATSKGINDASSLAPTISSSMPGSENGEEGTMESVKTGLQGFSEDQKRQIGISTISVVACLASEFKVEEVTRLTISMLLQRIRSAEPTVEAAIAYNLVELAIIAPESSFIDIIKAFSLLNRSANPDDPRFSSNTVRLPDDDFYMKLTMTFRSLPTRPGLHKSCEDAQNFMRST